MNRQINMVILIGIFLLAVWFLVFKSGNDQQAPGNQKTEPVQTGLIRGETSSSEVPSGDGLVKLILESTKIDVQNTKNTVKVVSEGNEKILLEMNLPSGHTLSIPDNTWSPDNKQFFIKQTSPDKIAYFVYKADGSTYKQGQLSLDIASYWSNTKYTYKITTVTGWADPDLLIVYTSKEDGSRGPSFWFVTSSHSFMQLREIS